MRSILSSCGDTSIFLLPLLMLMRVIVVVGLGLKGGREGCSPYC